MLFWLTQFLVFLLSRPIMSEGYRSSLPWKLYLGPACYTPRARGCLDPLSFFGIIEKTLTLRAAFLAYLLAFMSSHFGNYIFSAHVKMSDPGHLRSGHLVTSSDLTSKKVWILVIATPTDRSTWNFQRLISVMVSIKMYLGILIWVTQGQVSFATSPGVGFYLCGCLHPQSQFWAPTIAPEHPQ